MMKLVKQKKTVLYLPESFEYLILQSGILDDKEVREILAAPQEYIESQSYFSWERYFTALLIEKTNDSYLKYSKKALNPVYLQENIKNKMLQQMDMIEWDDCNKETLNSGQRNMHWNMTVITEIQNAVNQISVKRWLLCLWIIFFMNYRIMKTKWFN